jgi:surface protein
MNKKGNSIESYTKNQIVMKNNKEIIIMKKEDELKRKNVNEFKKNKKYLIRYSKKEYNSIKKKSKNEKVNKNLKFIFKTNIFIPLIFFFNLMLTPNISSENINNQSQSNQISFIIEGIGEQKLLGDNAIMPNEIIINDITQEINDNYFNMNKSLNNIIIRWNIPLTTCKDMFVNLNSMTFIDLSNFDFSKVTDMSGMFYGCNKLKSINFQNVNTNSLEMMGYSFFNCESLVSLDLSYFNTSKVITMVSLFYNCRSLISLTLFQ